MMMFLISSCSSAMYNSSTQASTMRSFSKRHHNRYVPIGKQTVVAHPATTKSTRKNLKQRLRASN